jgi:DNA-binding transcriptional MocR family regulator
MEIQAFCTHIDGWADTGHGPLPRRLAAAMRTLIITGALPTGAVVPAERPLAEALGVSRPTISTALDELRAEGLIISRRGSGTRVAEIDVSPAGPTLVERALGTATVNLAAPVAQRLPAGFDWAISPADLGAQVPANGYDPVGVLALRSLAAERLRTQGLSATTDHVLITNGAHHAMAVAVGALVRSGDRVIVEEHTFGGVLDLLDDRGAIAVPVARDSAGIVPSELDRRLATEPDAVAILLPTVNSPTGVATPSGRLDELAQILDRRATTVIADEALADLTHGSRPHGLGARCQHASVITIESLSKSVWGGLRVGWLTARPDLFEKLARQRARRDLGTAITSQLLAQRVLPALDDHLVARRHNLAAAATLATRLLRERFTDWGVELPSGGAMVWATLPIDDAAGFATYARQFGVATLPGSAVSASRNPDPHLRIATDVGDDVLRDGIDRLDRAWAAWRSA